MSFKAIAIHQGLLFTQVCVQISAKIKLMGAGRLLAVLNMSPSTMSKGPSTMTKGDTFHVTPSIYTLLWGQVTTPDSISTRHTNTLQQMITENDAKDTFKGSLFGCQENVSNTTLTIV